ncbi:hypothetical protein L2E82_10569 [Cichorium intybus]|uniref:Uncharacterized protein n=1 Tax=Cichorium intybus TaxID=13427 RepID=A0ACB9GAY7_CICIN|nr:hypothetical protein L2E82_10569 [Cichorium intybus]
MHVYVNEFLPDPSRIVVCSEQGIIVIQSGHPADTDLPVFHVCKPTTNQLQVDTINLPPSDSPTDSELITSGGRVCMLLQSGNIFIIDAVSEVWGIFPSPRTPGDPLVYSYKRLRKHEGKLGIDCELSNGLWDHWVLMVDDSWMQLRLSNHSEVGNDSWDYLYYRRGP